MFNNITSYQDIWPTVPESCFIHPGAQVIGDVELGEHTSVWPFAVIRGDVNKIRIGDHTNIQDLSMLHVSHRRPEDPEGAPLIIGSRVTIAHHVTLHGCTIGDECLIGIGTIVLDRAIIEPHVMVGAGSLVPPGKILKSGHLYLGSPVKEVRRLSPEELAHFKYSAEHYVKVKNHYKATK
ncbi:carbonic anhydrase/acetyltransferase-like protein (isoleucine patch superfamily) [Chitinivorax tropicus]|uniref:Carbonic anhydrase/acetyltransferase-like protein (Isoleucine patch superfamily) n=1 Tax=Chitinivorax tropicus TaxID=714531 RepID=A0A840MTL4_9PROT|nr:gamma carbonic anhydrase family protein [Chitinivorax tropicus]MBB5020429.1 carbonic anhydrase/acetyltransferase-like protein (isoleucine patch superfamily) [Chitinivorax tropicus]